MKTFVPFSKTNNSDVTIVDGLHPNNVCFSHWKGANTHKGISADTSGEIVLNALSSNYLGIDNNFVSATHFDIDGFVGVFALFYPKLALEYKNVLIAMARIGDFREYLPENKEDDVALKLCCWINNVEKEKFYRPFERRDEIESCVEKFDFFLPLFKDILRQIDNHEKVWRKEYDTVKNGIQFEQSTTKYPEIGLIKKKYRTQSHYYSLFSNTNGFDIVLSMYPNNKFELEYKYTTWVDLESRPNLPRIDLKGLALQLNEIEQSEYNWQVDSISDTGPILRLESTTLSKADRYANPAERIIYSSSICPETFEELITSFFYKVYEEITPKKNWTWNEMRNLKS